MKPFLEMQRKMAHGMVKMVTDGGLQITLRRLLNCPKNGDPLDTFGCDTSWENAPVAGIAHTGIE